MKELDAKELIDENISHLNVGSGEETVFDLAKLVKKTIGFKGKLEFDDEKPDGTLKIMIQLD